MIKLLNIDCMEYMATQPDNAFDLAIVDPPYGLPERSGKGAGKLADRKIQEMHKKGWDIKPDKRYFSELKRVSKEQIIWGGNYFDLPPNRGFIIWDKMQPWPNFAACEYAWNSIDGVAKLFKYDNRQDSKQHPTQKPIKLYEWLLNNFAICKKCKGQYGYYEDVAGDGFSREWIGCEVCGGVPAKILDTHLGSGSSAIAAHYFGCDFVGCEIDEEYYKAAYERFERETAQIDMFSV